MQTGYKDLDNIIELTRKDLVVIGSRPAIGKTTLALNIATNVAVKENTSVAIFSLEMSKKYLVERLLCDENKIYIDDTPNISVLEIGKRCKKLKNEKNIELVVIDYLQLIHEFDIKNEEQETIKICKYLKELANELDIAIIITAQLSKEIDIREDKRACVSDFEKSKNDILEYSDKILLLYKKQGYESKDVEVVIAKNNNGDIANIKLKI